MHVARPSFAQKGGWVLDTAPIYALTLEVVDAYRIK